MLTTQELETEYRRRLMAVTSILHHVEIHALKVQTTVRKFERMLDKLEDVIKES